MYVNSMSFTDLEAFKACGELPPVSLQSCSVFYLSILLSFWSVAVLVIEFMTNLSSVAYWEQDCGK